MLSRRVDLPSGGYLMIDYAEALTVIDVNTGSFTGKGKQARLEDTITKTNLEAAEEVVSQLRLRDIGGIIVIDFIDMARSRNRDAVLKTLRASLEEDRTKTFVVEISPLGLVEMTRQNVTDGVREIMTKPCPTCDGEGVVKSEETIAIEVERRLREIVKAAGPDGPEAYLVRLNPRVTAYFTGDGARELHALEAETGRSFHFEGSEGLPLDHFAITLEGTRDQVMERAVPFSDGDEVHVEIVEPHMYNADDAVAKVDGYLISVVNGGAFVGEKKLVRIEEAGPHGGDRGARGQGRRAGRGGRRGARQGPRPGRAAGAAQRRRQARRGQAQGATGRADASPSRRRPPTPRRRRPSRRSPRARRRRRAPGRPPSPTPRATAPRPRGGQAAPPPPAQERRRRRAAPGTDGAQAAAEADGEDGKRASRGRSRRRAKADDAGADGAATPEADAAEAAADADQDGDDALSSRPRRRGRRGGRRRSRAKAEADRAEVSEASD